jgi:competence protein ComEC
MPLLWLSLAILTGIILASVIPQPQSTWLILAGISALWMLIRYITKRRNLNRVGVFLSGFQNPFFRSLLPLPVLFTTAFVGASRYQATLPDFTNPNFISAHNGYQRQMMVTGLVVTMPDRRDTRTTLRVEVEYMHPANDLYYTDVTGTILVTTSTHKQFHYGDRVVIRGYLETPPENEAFSYRDYLAHQGIYTQINNARVSVLETNQGNWLMARIFRLKEILFQVIFQLWPDPEASLFSGILLGIESTIPDPVEKAFKETGTSHIIAISGFNIAIVVVYGVHIKVGWQP